MLAFCTSHFEFAHEFRSRWFSDLCGFEVCTCKARCGAIWLAMSAQTMKPCVGGLNTRASVRYYLAPYCTPSSHATGPVCP